MKILVIGGTNIDIYGRVTNKLINKDSNNGTIDFSIGGVGKNISENLVRLGLDVSFATVLGNDDFNLKVKKHLSSLNLTTIIKESNLPTPKYLAIFDEENDFRVGVNEMDALNDLDINFIKELEFDKYDLLVIDANLSEQLIEYIVNNANIPIYAEAISTKKVLKFKPYLNKLTALKCNMLEANALLNSNELPALNLAEKLANQGLKEVYLTDSSNGSYLFIDNLLRYFPSISEEIVNTSGAGDAFLAGVIYAKVYKKPELLYGNSLASITLKVKEANNQELTKELLESVVNKYGNRA